MALERIKDDAHGRHHGDLPMKHRNLIPIPFLPEGTDNPVVKVDGAPFRLHLKSVSWLNTARVVSISVQVIAEKSGMIPLIRALSKSGEQVDVLPPETNPDIPDSWHDGRRFCHDGQICDDMFTSELVISSNDTLSIEVRLLGPGFGYFAVSAIVTDLSGLTTGLIDRRRSFQPENGSLKLLPLVASCGGRVFKAQGGNGEIGPYESVECEVRRSCVLHDILVQSHDNAVGVVPVVRDLEVIRSGSSVPYTLGFIGTEHGGPLLAEEFTDVRLESRLLANPILMDGDKVRMSIGAFSASGQPARGTASIVVHDGFSQREVSDLLDYLRLR